MYSTTTNAASIGQVYHRMMWMFLGGHCGDTSGMLAQLMGQVMHWTTNATIQLSNHLQKKKEEHCNFVF
jgi:hypothetical protein